MKDALSKEVYWILKNTSGQIKKELRDKLTENDITWPQYHALYHIGEEGTPANELAKELNCNASNMTGLIDRMIENRWVYREHSAEDRRVWLVKLTDEGKELRSRLIPIHLRNIEDRMSVLNEEELSTLKALLEKLVKGKGEVK
jgi:MarR family transcriptional regulator, organic hydroperoxide resistance regulator